jgi:hypothetical protein
MMWWIIGITVVVLVILVLYADGMYKAFYE